MIIKVLKVFRMSIHKLTVDEKQFDLQGSKHDFNIITFNNYTIQFIGDNYFKGR